MKTRGTPTVFVRASISHSFEYKRSVKGLEQLSRHHNWCTLQSPTTHTKQMTPTTGRCSV